MNNELRLTKIKAKIKSRIETRLENQRAARASVLDAVSIYGPEWQKKVFDRVAHLTLEHGGTDGLSVFLEQYMTGRSPNGVDMDGLRIKVMGLSCAWSTIAQGSGKSDIETWLN